MDPPVETDNFIAVINVAANALDFAPSIMVADFILMTYMQVYFVRGLMLGIFQ